MFNNRGVTKFTDAPHVVDHSFDAEITVSGQCAMVVKELLAGGKIPVEGKTFTHRIAAGDLAVFEVAVASQRSAGKGDEP